jgi:hypothetical protein
MNVLCRTLRRWPFAKRISLQSDFGMRPHDGRRATSPRPARASCRVRLVSRTKHPIRALGSVSKPISRAFPT